MTQEERTLLLKDLCARLQYGVFCKIQGYEEPKKLIRIEVDEVDGVLLDFGDNEEGLPIQVYLSQVKPYLRPIPSMTKEEVKIYRDTMGELPNERYLIRTLRTDDFLDSNCFDCRHLIEKGLVLEAPEDMYNGN